MGNHLTASRARSQYWSPGHHKGLQNRTGENNCFLNVTVQALWHLDSFRAAVRGMETTADYEYYEGSVAPTELRKHLASIDPERYSLGVLADATEALYSILSQIHMESCRHATLPGGVVTENDNCSCLAHNIFGGLFVEQHSCSACRAASEPQITRRMLHYINADEVCGSFTASPTRISFSSTLRSCLSPVAHECRSLLDGGHQCQRKGMASLYCLETPQVLALCVTWAEERACLDKLASFICSIDTSLSVHEVFNQNSVSNQARGRGCVSHVLCGLVCFYGRHYISFFRDSLSPTAFLLFDDSRTRVVGTWAEVKEECFRSRYQPVLLLYQLNQNSPEQEDPEPSLYQLIPGETIRIQESELIGKDNKDACGMCWDSYATNGGAFCVVVTCWIFVSLLL